MAAISPQNLTDLARKTGLSENVLAPLVANGDIWVQSDSAGDLAQYGASTLAGATPLVNAGVNMPDPRITGSNNPDVNRAIAIAQTMNIPFTKINDGSAFAQFGITDPQAIQEIQAGARNYQEFQNQSATTARRGTQTFTRNGLLAVVGGGLAMNASMASSAANAGGYEALGNSEVAAGNTSSLGLNAGTQPLQLADASMTDVPVQDILPGDPGYVPPEIPGTPPTGAPPNWAPVTEGTVTPVSYADRVAQVLSSAGSVLPSAGTIKTAANVTGILGGAAMLVGAGKVVAGGGTTTTASQGVTAPPPTPLETQLLQLQIDALTRDQANYAALQPVQQAQIAAAQAELNRQQAHDPGAINDYVRSHLMGPDGNISQTGVQQIQDAARRFGVTVTEIANATGFTPEQITQHSNLTLTPAEVSANQQQEITRIQLDQLRQGTNATPEQITQINAATSAAQTAGEADINRFRDETLRRINEEVAQASGLSPTDTPIAALNDRAGAEVARQQGILTSNLQGANANARLNYPLAAQQVQTATANSAGNLNLASEQFQADLANTAANNRYRLFQNPVTVPTSNNAAGSLALGLGNQRIGLGTTNATTTRGLGLSDYSNLLGGIGGIMRGASSLGLG